MNTINEVAKPILFCESGSANIYESAILATWFENKKGKGLKTRRIRLNNKIANPTNIFWGSWEGFIWDEVCFSQKVRDCLKMRNW